MSTTSQDPPELPGTPGPEPSTESGLVPPADAMPLPPQPGSPPSAGSPPLHRRPVWLVPVLTGVLGLLIGSAGTAFIASQRAAAADRAEASASAASASSSAAAEEKAKAARAAVLTHAADVCGTAHVSGMTLADEGTSLTFDMKGEEDTRGADITSIMCVFNQLKMPSAVLSHIEQTTSMDGRQSETWDNVTVSWSYHPDRGLDGVLTVAQN